MTLLQRFRHSPNLAALVLLTMIASMLPARSANADSPAPPPAVPSSGMAPGSSSLGVAETDVAGATALASARVQPGTGFMTAAIPFELPRARGGVQPELSLNYNSSSGVGVGGLGWSLNLPSIERHNPSGPPQFNEPQTGSVDPTQQDRFTFGGEPLVLICFVATGGACLYKGNNPDRQGQNELIAGEVLPTLVTGGGWHYYRLATETGALLRFFWSPDHTQWLVQAKTGETSIYGVPSDDRSDLGATDRDLQSRIFRWNLARRYDTQRGFKSAPTNLVRYQWTQMGIMNAGTTGTQFGFLTDIYDTPPLMPAPPVALFAHHTHLVYGQSQATKAASAPIWRAVPPRLLTRVDVTSQDFLAQGQRQQVRRYILTYNTASYPTSVLGVYLVGNCDPAINNFEDGTTYLLPDPSAVTKCTPPSRPATRFGYQQAAPMTVSRLPDLASSANLVPFDYNSDGLPDIPDYLAAPPIVQLNALTTPGTFTPTPAKPGVPGVATAGAFQMDAQLDGLVYNIAPTVITTTGHAPGSDTAIPYLVAAPALVNGSWDWIHGTTGTFGLVRGYPTDSLEASFPFETFIGDEQPYVPMDVDGDGIVDLATTGVWGYLDSEYIAESHAVLHRFLSVRFSKRCFDATYSPFFGSNISGATTAARVDMCMGGMGLIYQRDDTAHGRQDGQLDNGSDNNRNPIKAYRTFGDLNGDGLPDYVQLDQATNAVYWWPGHGDGVFGDCPQSESLQCACDQALKTIASVPLASGDSLNTASIADVNGDGLGDIVTIIPDGINVYLNDQSGFVGFLPAIPVHVNATMGLGNNNTSGSGFQSPPIQFADMDGSGTSDIIVSNPWTGPGSTSGPTKSAYVDMTGGVRPGLLTTIVSGAGLATTSVVYDSTPNLARQATQAGAPWATSSPQIVHVVTSITTTALFGDSYTTSYTYRDPVYDGRDSAFLGFRNVVETTPGNATTAMSTATTFFYAACGGQNPTPCAPSVDDVRHSYRGLPVLTEVYNGTNTRQDGFIVTSMALSTTHHSYAETSLYFGSDDRTVRRIYDAETDVYLYDTSPFVSAPHKLSLADVSAPSDGLTSAPGFLIRASAQHLMKTTSLDAFGNVATVTDSGNESASDPVIVTTTTWSMPAAEDATNNWTWRIFAVGVGSSVADAAVHSTSYRYDAYGNMTDVATVLSGTAALLRPAAGAAPAPVGASQDGAVNLAHIVYSTGNITQIQLYPSSTTGSSTARCLGYDYDPAYGQLKTTDTVYVGDCGSTVSMVTQHGYDRVRDVETFTVSPGGARSARVYDGLGRLTSVAKPEPTLPSFVDSPSTTITYSDTTYGQVIHTSQAGGTGYAAYDRFTYRDGLGRTLQTVSSGDAPQQWVLSGQVTRDVRGRVVASYAPAFISGQDGGAFGFSTPTTPARRVSYDAFGRVTQTLDIDGTVTGSFKYHALSVDSQDAENANPASAHAAAYVTTARDGHGRRTSVTQWGNGAGGAVTTSTTYLPTGQPAMISRTGSDANGPVNYVRYMKYDSMGRLVVNAEPNTSENYSPNVGVHGTGHTGYWTYAYNDLGDLVGTSDARGCGENFVYDGAGRVLAEDYSPCPGSVPSTYSAPTALPGGGDGTEAFYVYEQTGSLQTGRVSDVYDRASHTQMTYDGRGRVSTVERYLAQPGTPADLLSARYSTTGFLAVTTYDDRDRVATQSTGADVASLQSTNAALTTLYGASAVAGTYSTRGMIQKITSSYGQLMASTGFEADGRPDGAVYGDVAKTTATYSYNDPRLRLTEVKIARTASFPGATSTYTPPSGLSIEPTQQAVLADDVVQQYDRVGNPVIVADGRTAAEWPAGAQPVVSRTYGYDDSYRVTSVTSTFAGSVADTFVPPLATMTAMASPMPMSSPANRTTKQLFSYDGMGSLIGSTDDSQVFFDRSLGTATTGNSSTATAGGPNQLLGASMTTSTTGHWGSLTPTYDYAGNMVQLQLRRTGTCAGGVCNQLFQYDWDEVGRLARARRYDFAAGSSCHFTNHWVCDPNPMPTDYIYPALPTAAASADVSYSYGAGGQRVLRASTPANEATTYSAEIFPSLRLNHTSWDGSGYVRTADTEGVYLTFAGLSLGRVVYNASAPAIVGYQHVFLELTDVLGSTSTVIDKDTSELVERTTYLPYGGIESDYRPQRWNFREEYKFSGKEDDVEIGLSYFGARYYSPQLGRWISPDPLAVHAPGRGDLNPYAYVQGRVATDVDPFGLDPEPSWGYGGATVQNNDQIANSIADGTYVAPPTTIGTVVIVGNTADISGPAVVDPRGYAAEGDVAASYHEDLGTPPPEEPIDWKEIGQTQSNSLAKASFESYETAKAQTALMAASSLPGLGTVILLAQAMNPNASTGSRVVSGVGAVLSVVPLLGGVFGRLPRGAAFEGAAVRRLATAGDTQFRTAGDALAGALERHGIDPSTVETTTMYGKNQNLLGPKGEPWEMVRGLNGEGDVVEFQHHANGHVFEDGTFELPHYHGPNGEHLTYDGQ